MKKSKPPALLEGKVYHQFPHPPNHKYARSVDPEADYWWTAEDWELFMSGKHPHIIKDTVEDQPYLYSGVPIQFRLFRKIQCYTCKCRYSDCEGDPI